MSSPILFVLYLVSYLAGKARVDFTWYGIPSGFAYMVTVICGLGVIGRHLPPKPYHGLMLGFIGVFLTLALLASSVFVWRATRAVYYENLRSSYGRAGEFVDRVASPTDRLLTAEEFSRYHGRLSTCDPLGLGCLNGIMQSALQAGLPHTLVRFLRKPSGR